VCVSHEDLIVAAPDQVPHGPAQDHLYDLLNGRGMLGTVQHSFERLRVAIQDSPIHHRGAIFGCVHRVIPEENAKHIAVACSAVALGNICIYVGVLREVVMEVANGRV
jgi:hypothetical protein